MLTAHDKSVNNFFNELHSKRIYFGSDTHQIKTAIEVGFWNDWKEQFSKTIWRAHVASLDQWVAFQTAFENCVLPSCSKISFLILGYRAMIIERNWNCLHWCLNKVAQTIRRDANVVCPNFLQSDRSTQWWIKPQWLQSQKWAIQSFRITTNEVREKHENNYSPIHVKLN